MNYKVGDKLLCNFTNMTSAEEGKIYTILQIYNSTLIILNTRNPNWGFLTINTCFIKLSPILEYILTNPKNLL